MKPALIYQKNAERTTNKITLPKAFVEKNGRSYYMEIYEGYLILKPIDKTK
jgi:hypothetical protein